MLASLVSAGLMLCASMAGSRPDACATILPEHALFPFALPWGALLVTHTPTVLLASRERTRHLCAATARVLLIWATGVATAWAYTRSPQIAYATALHSTALLLGIPSGLGVMIGANGDRCLRWACTGLLLTGAWQLGPSLPIVDTALAHLVGRLAPELLLPPCFALLELLCLAGGGAPPGP
jgi:hypothetical protein